MQRRKTTIGRGPFGRTISTDKHADEVLRRIRSKGLPLTEDAVFLYMNHILRRNNASRIFQKVRESKNVGGYRYFSFSPDVDLLGGELMNCPLCGLVMRETGSKPRQVEQRRRRAISRMSYFYKRSFSCDNNACRTTQVNRPEDLVWPDWSHAELINEANELDRAFDVAVEKE